MKSKTRTKGKTNNKKSRKTPVKDLSKINLKTAGTGYEFVSTYKGNILRKKPLTKRTTKKTKTKVKRKSKGTTKKTKAKTKSKGKTTKTKQKGAGCSSNSNQYLLVQGSDIPASEYAPAFKIEDQFAKLHHEATQNNEIIVDHPHLVNKFN